jgi:C6 transcription factor Pro1
MRAAQFPLLSADGLDLGSNEASRFLIGSLLWSDILAGVSTGRRPLLYAYLQRLLSPSGQPAGPLIKMEDIMGCENHVMLLISEISALQEWKMNSLKSRSLSTWRLVTRSKTILDDLEMAILRLDRQLDAYGPYSKDEMVIHHTKIITGTITSIFACAAVVYLHVGMYYLSANKWQIYTLCSLLPMMKLLYLVTIEIRD